jgi:predicted GIY-YIG superfamily endonuclease
MSKKPNGYWTYERCKEVCLRYDKKNVLQKENSSVYNAIFNNKWFELYDHMAIQGNKYKRLVYVFEFSDNYCYVGLTGNIKRRENQHRFLDLNSSVFNHSKETNIEPKLVIKSDYIKVEDAIKLEYCILEEYKSNNWNVLNKVKTGGVGSINLIWTKDKCKVEADKYDKISDYQKNSKSSYNSALKNGWIDEICSHMQRRKSKNKYWDNKELCRKESLKYRNITEFQKKCWSAYNYSKINGWLYEFYPKNNNI